MADAALVTADNLAALRDTCFITRLPATYSACGRVIAEAVAHNGWEEVGVLAQTPPTKHRPGTCSTVAEGRVTVYGKAYRAVVVHSSSQDQRRPQPLQRELQASSATLEATGREGARPRGLLSRGCRSRRRQAADAAERLSRGTSRRRGAPAVWPWTAEPPAATPSQSGAVWPAGHPARAI